MRSAKWHSGWFMMLEPLTRSSAILMGLVCLLLCSKLLISLDLVFRISRVSLSQFHCGSFSAEISGPSPAEDQMNSLDRKDLTFWTSKPIDEDRTPSLNRFNQTVRTFLINKLGLQRLEMVTIPFRGKGQSNFQVQVARYTPFTHRLVNSRYHKASATSI